MTAASNSDARKRQQERRTAAAFMASMFGTPTENVAVADTPGDRLTVRTTQQPDDDEIVPKTCRSRLDTGSPGDMWSPIRCAMAPHKTGDHVSCTIQVGGTPVRWTDEEAMTWTDEQATPRADKVTAVV